MMTNVALNLAQALVLYKEILRSISSDFRKNFGSDNSGPTSAGWIPRMWRRQRKSAPDIL